MVARQAGQELIRTGQRIFFTTCEMLVQELLIAKRDLMNEVWPNTVVEENNLDRNISTLRKVLGEQENGEPYIETVPRVGYRFVAAVREAATATAPRPRSNGSTAKQEIRFCITRDNVRLAYATAGTGHPIVKVASCFNHLVFEWESPIWRHLYRELSNGHTFIRYDARGNGLSDREVTDV